MKEKDEGLCNLPPPSKIPSLQFRVENPTRKKTLFCHNAMAKDFA